MNRKAPELTKENIKKAKQKSGARTLPPYCVYARFYMKDKPSDRVKTVDLFIELTPGAEEPVSLKRLKEMWGRSNFLEKHILPILKSYTRKVLGSGIFVIPDYVVDKIDNLIVFWSNCHIKTMYAIPIQTDSCYGVSGHAVRQAELNLTWHRMTKSGKKLFCLNAIGRPDKKTCELIRANKGQINQLIESYYMYAISKQDGAFRDKLNQLTGCRNSRVIAADWIQAVFEPNMFSQEEQEALMKQDFLLKKTVSNPIAM